MIVKMKKVHVIIRKTDMDPALNALRDLGAIHVEHQEDLAGEKIEQKHKKVDLLESALQLLQAETSAGDDQPKSTDDPEKIADEVLDLRAQTDQLNERIAKRRILISQWEAWGDFDPKDLDQLKERGIYVQLCVVPKDKRDDAPEGVTLSTVFSSSGIDRCVALSEGEIELPFEVVEPPSMGLSEMQARQEEEQKQVSQIQLQIGEYVGYIPSLERALRGREEDLRFEEVAQGMHADEMLSVLKGYCPVDVCEAVQEKARAEHWGILFEDPTEEDRVPTLVRNPKWVSLIKPVFNFIDIAPGYREYDISLFFLIFFSVFVGMLIGDAGYGLLFILFIARMQMKMRGKVKDMTPFHLAYLMSGCVIGWGLLTGTVFGQQWLAGTSVRPLLPWLKDNDNVQLFCFVLGAVHLSLAHVWRMIQKFPSVSFLSDIGWLSLLWGMFGMARILILGATMSALTTNLLIAGAVLVLFFTRPHWNPLKAIGPGLGDLALNAVNTFTDIVSYIRLFAVGLATVAVADATNTMAADIGGLGMVIVLLIGHTINIVLALMAILVHGLRLNVLEFSGHLNMEWTGINYSPFKKVKNT